MGFTAVFQEVDEGLIAFIEELPGVNTQAATLAEARENLHEAVELVLAANRKIARETRLAQPNEFNKFLVRKICRDLAAVDPAV